MKDFLAAGIDAAVAAQLPDSFETDAGASAAFLVTNEPGKGQVDAPEINRFLARSRSDSRTQARALQTLYEARAIRFDRLYDEPRTRIVGRRVAVMGEEAAVRKLGESLKAQFEVVLAPKKARVLGSVGEFLIEVEGARAECDLIVLTEPDEALLKRKGVLLAAERVENQLEALTGEVSFVPGIEVSLERCQLHDRQSETCTVCIQACPTAAITKAEGVNRLVFSEIDCIACGACVSVCPSNALEASAMPAAVFEEILPLYENTVPLVIAQNDFEAIGVSLPGGVVPLVLDSTGFLSEAQFLGLLQESGSQSVLFAPRLNEGSAAAVGLVNEISLRLYGKKAVLHAADAQSLEAALETAMPLSASRHNVRAFHPYKREQFAARLKAAVGAEQLGSVGNFEPIRYGTVKVAEAGCTLCMSCVAACSPSALFVDAKGGALMGDFSKCTQCGECAAICPEKVMALEPSGIDLSASWFEPVKLAQDEPFCCVECGKPFATHKSVMKIAALLEPLFMSDPIKARTLRCCAECKPKVMLQAHLGRYESAKKEA